MRACRYCGRYGRYYCDEPEVRPKWITWAAYKITTHHQEPCPDCGNPTVWMKGAAVTLVMPCEKRAVSRLHHLRRSLAAQLTDSESWESYHQRLVDRIEVLQGALLSLVDVELRAHRKKLVEAVLAPHLEREAHPEILLLQARSNVSVRLVRQGVLTPSEALELTVWPSSDLTDPMEGLESVELKRLTVTR